MYTQIGYRVSENSNYFTTSILKDNNQNLNEKIPSKIK